MEIWRKIGGKNILELVYHYNLIFKFIYNLEKKNIIIYNIE